MGMRGPQPTPTAVLRLAGSRRAKARGKVEPKPKKKSKPTAPRRLSKDEAVVWRRLCKHLDMIDLLSSVDSDAIEMYAVAYVRWRECERFIKENGIKYPIKNKKGEVTSIGQFPEVSESRSLAKQLVVLAREFGLTPAARARIGIDRLSSGTKGMVSDVSEIGFTAG